MRPLLGVAASLLMLFSLTPLAKAQNQADAYYPPAEMEAAREALREGAGGQRLFSCKPIDWSINRAGMMKK